MCIKAFEKGLHAFIIHGANEEQVEDARLQRLNKQVKHTNGKPHRVKLAYREYPQVPVADSF